MTPVALLSKKLNDESEMSEWPLYDSREEEECSDLEEEYEEY